MCLPETYEVVRKQVEEDRRRLDRRAMLLAGAGAAVAAALPATARANDGKGDDDDDDERGGKHGGRSQDLTHVFRAGFPMFTGASPARTTIANYATHGFYAQGWSFGEHSATHMDAPGHFVPGGRKTPAITVEELVAPAAVVDISDRAKTNPDATVTRDDLRRFERRHGRIPRGAVVFMNSGWAAKAGDPLAYKGGAAFPGYHFPGFAIDAVEWLLAERTIKGIGVDTLSLDPGNSTTFPVHVKLLGADRYGLENVANLDKIPPRGARVYVGVIPWEEGSGGPARLLARW